MRMRNCLGLLHLLRDPSKSFYRILVWVSDLQNKAFSSYGYSSFVVLLTLKAIVAFQNSAKQNLSIWSVASLFSNYM